MEAHREIEGRQALQCVIEVLMEELSGARKDEQQKRVAGLEIALEQNLSNAVRIGWLEGAKRIAKSLGRPLRQPDELRVITAVAVLNDDRVLMKKMEETDSIILRPEEVENLAERFGLRQPEAICCD